MEKDLEKYCMKMMDIYGGTYTIDYDLKVVRYLQGRHSRFRCPIL